jgi:hypothetical protein
MYFKHCVVQCYLESHFFNKLGTTLIKAKHFYPFVRWGGQNMQNTYIDVASKALFPNATSLPGRLPAWPEQLTCKNGPPKVGLFG